MITKFLSKLLDRPTQEDLDKQLYITIHNYLSEMQDIIKVLYGNDKQKCINDISVVDELIKLRLLGE